MKLLERFRIWLGLKLLITNQVTMTARIMSRKVEQARCIHCGKNPYFIDPIEIEEATKTAAKSNKTKSATSGKKKEGR